MKKHLVILFLGLYIYANLSAQPFEVKEAKTGKFSYQYVTNDPYKAHKYVLSNGMTIITSVNKKEPRVQTYIAIKAGSKTDPANSTGLAHYLEHLLFKGTENYGTVDYKTEKPYLDMIDVLYREYNATKDETKRKNIYHKIDSVSGLAAKYAIANEYDKMMQNLGAVGTNAFTSFEQTVYVNDVPSNNLEKWLKIEGERFHKPVFRIFHTELEAVFEEKNISLDNDDSKVYEAITSNLFKSHPYGTQTTIGTVEHLKNPSLDNIRNYFNKFYRPNNMALIMVGDFDEEKTIAMAEKYFSVLEPKNVDPFTFKPETSLAPVEPIIVRGPSAEFMAMGFRFPGVGTRDAAILKLASQIIYNGKGGLIDLDLVKSQKITSAVVYTDILKDYSYMMFKIKPKSTDAVESTVSLINDEITKLLKGSFDDELITAVKANMKVDLIRKQESREASADMILDAFTTDFDWKNYIEEFDIIQKLTKKDIVDFALKYLSVKPVIVYKKQGEDANIVKVIKPEITPVDVESNRDSRSAFAQSIDIFSSSNIEPKYIDYNKEIITKDISNGLSLYHTTNKDNELYEMHWIWDMGKEHNKKLPLAIQYLKYIGTNNYSNDQFNKELYKLATEFNIYSSNKAVTITLSGLKENMNKAITLVDDLLNNAKVDEQKFKEFQSYINKNRTDDMLNKGIILRAGLRNIAMYGLENPFSYNLTNDGILKLAPIDLLSITKSLKLYKHKIFYYGPQNVADITTNLLNLYRVKSTLMDYPTPMLFKQIINSEPIVYFVDYNMVQAEILWLKNEQVFDPNLTTTTTLFQEYYGGGMGSIVFQTIRESKALAYSCNMRFSNPESKDKPYIVTGYIGTQADKLFESITAMNDLLSNMPESEELLSSCKSTIRSQIETERLNGMDILYNYENLKRLGITYDIRKDVYENVNSLDMGLINKFFESYIKSGVYNLCVIGNKKNIKIEEFKKYGKFTELSIKQVFGY